jgi:prepilin-type N-terminal cleavage/methylation domain-containing protein
MKQSLRRPVSSRAFTLIELLIVLGIILILAGIAMENYLAASIRARVARVKAEHRTLAGAIEAYRVDHNRPPRMAHRRIGDPQFDIIQGVPVSGVVTKVLSTPVAYVTVAHFYDPFMEKAAEAPLDERLYTYQTIPEYIRWNPDSIFWPAALGFYGDWRLASVGPDQTFDHGFANSAQLPYDPTNGLVSFGNIWSSQRHNEAFPPIPLLLGKH